MIFQKSVRKTTAKSTGIEPGTNLQIVKKYMIINYYLINFIHSHEVTRMLKGVGEFNIIKRLICYRSVLNLIKKTVFVQTLVA